MPVDGAESRLLVSATNGIPQLTLRGGRKLQYEIQTSTNLTAWSSLGTVTITNGLGGAPGSFVDLPVGPTTVIVGVAVLLLGVGSAVDDCADTEPPVRGPATALAGSSWPWTTVGRIGPREII